MRRAPHLPVEPLSDARWKRVEAALFQELDDQTQAVASPGPWRTPRWGVGLAAVLVVLQVAALLLLLLRNDNSPPELSGVRFESQEQESVQMLGDVELALEPRSALVAVADRAGGSLCVLEHGAVRFAVPHRGGRAPFVIQAGAVRVEVVGTRFRVERGEAGTRVTTYEGLVRVIEGDREALVGRGQTWPTRQPDTNGPEGRTGPGTPDRTPAQSALPTPATQGALQQAQFERATALEAGNPEQALRMYRALATGEGAWSQNALYAEGRLQLELARRAEARRILQDYVRRYPQGANAEDARTLLQRLKPER